MHDVDLTDVDLTDLDRFAVGFPHDVFTRLRQEAPVWFHRPTSHTPGGEGFWVISRYADVVAVASDARTYSSERGGARDGGGTLIEDLPAGFATGVLLNMMDDPRHQKLRRLATGTVSPRALAILEQELRARTATIVDAAVARGTCDFLLDVAAELPLQAVARLLGVPQEDRHKLFAWANATLDHEGRELGEIDARMRAAQAAMFEYGTWLIAEKRKAPGDDMLSAVVHGALTDADGAAAPPTELEQLMFFNLLIAAGSETTRNSLAVGLLALIEHPAAWDVLRRDTAAVMSTAVEEILRWASSTAYNRRTATRDAALGEARIAAGDKITLWWSSANRDEDVFPEPFRFDLRRHPNRHVAFGHGNHFCLGAVLARLEIRLVLEALVARVAGCTLAGPIEWTRSNKHTGIRHMPVSFRR
jgi:cytochrome P450